MIRVLHIVTQMGCGGLENRLMDIYRNIDRSRIQFDFFTNRMETGYFDMEIAAMGGIVYYNPPITISTMCKKYMQVVSFLRCHAEYKIVHSNVNEWSTIFCTAAKTACVPVRIAHSRGANNKRSIKKVAKNIIKLPIKKYATHYFAVSAIAGQHLFGGNAYKKNRIMIWPNAIDCEKYRFDFAVRNRMRRELNCNQTLVVMHVGNFTMAKNHPFLIEVFAQIKKIVPDAKLFLIGGGERKVMENLKRWSKRCGVSDSVIFLGIRSDVSALLQSADIFVFPSTHEGFPGAVLEAEAAGVPCLISNTVTEEVCLFSNCVQMDLSSKPSEWARKALELAACNRKDQYSELCEKGYDIHTVAKKYEEFYWLTLNK